MRIGLDYDDLIVDYARALLKYYNDRYPKRRKQLKHLEAYNLQTILDFSTREQYLSFLSDFERSRERKKIKAIKGANQGVLDLHSKSHELFLITDSGIELYDRINERLRLRFPNCFSKIFFTRLYLESYTPKDEICERENIELMCDDNPEVIYKCATRNIKGLIFSRPWNINFDPISQDLTQRVDSWEEIVNHSWLS